MIKIHILGIAGTFMGSLALLARELGFHVSGQDTGVYPPMSTQLSEHNIAYTEGYELSALLADIDLVVIGNVMRRGMPIVEHILNNKIPYLSGPAFLEQYILKDKHVLVVTGTHGKTTTSSLLAWCLEVAGLAPGFLIGGKPLNFGVSARLGGGKYFVIEGDEYDSAFFDKNSKFLHYPADTLIINNLEFDHADIFKDLDAIIWQFHLLLRKLPANSKVIYNANDRNIHELRQRGCWSQEFAFTAESLPADLQLAATLRGQHNRSNAAAVYTVALELGITSSEIQQALLSFKSVARRLELKGEAPGLTVYSDFAHHPTAIATTIAALTENLGNNKLCVILDLCSNSMRAGVHKDKLAEALAAADSLYFYHSRELAWDVNSLQQSINKPGAVYTDYNYLFEDLSQSIEPNTTLLIMSNGALDAHANALFDMLCKVVV